MKASAVQFFEPFYLSLVELARADTDEARYVELLERGVRAGDDHAAYALGSLLVHGDGGVNRNVTRGLRLMERATRSVHLAMLEMATIYESGDHGVRANEKKAFGLFARAVEYGSVVARFHLGRCHYLGIGTTVDKRKGNALIRAAARLGFAAWDHVGRAASPEVRVSKGQPRRTSTGSGKRRTSRSASP